ncbi:MAG: hypothetical protein EA366_15990 [Spirulina sp. DLM2.Bin59]|nr:MAG: hypothetical protein EA366_15990 [Spirulina sp. DLM2.Bin59]
MVSEFPFSYSECFPNRTLLRIPEKLKISGNHDPEMLLIIRLLSGAITLEHKHSSKKISQKENYFLADLQGYSQYWDRNFPKLIAEGYGVEQLSDFLNSQRFSNRSFYKNILSELSYFFYYQKKEAYLSAFIFLYRVLEHISYALPLIYVSKTDDFKETFNFLKRLMTKDAGELGFFKKFIDTVYKDDPIRESSVDFEISLNTESEQSNTYKLLFGLCKSEMIADSTLEPRVLSIKYTEVGSFLITIRNRFFHYMNSQRNIESSNIPDIDVIFSLTNKKFLYWISTIFLAVISHNAIEFERMNALILQQSSQTETQ